MLGGMILSSPWPGSIVTIVSMAIVGKFGSMVLAPYL